MAALDLWKALEGCSSLSGRIALVTGSMQGIGLAIARGLAEAGARTVVNGRTAARVGEALASLDG